MSDFPPLHDADALKRLLAGVCHPPAAVAEKVRGVYDELLRQSPRIRSGNFTQFADPDLALLFDLYDEWFFAGGLRRLSTRRPARSRSARRAASRAPPAPRRDSRPAGREPGPRHAAALRNRHLRALMFQTFHDVQRSVRVNGLLCRDRVEALQRVFEHELIHLLEMLLWTRSSCSAARFKGLVWNYFGHTATKHDLITQGERASNRFGLRLGDRVTFVFEGVRRVGVVNRITQRATILVESAAGTVYTDGKRYEKFYIPLGLLEKAGPASVKTTERRPMRQPRRLNLVLGLAVGPSRAALVPPPCRTRPTKFRPLAELAGRVLDADGPVSGATVRFQAKRDSTMTDADGRFHLAPDASAARVVAWKEGFFIGFARPDAVPLDVSLKRLPPRTIPNMRGSIPAPTARKARAAPAATPRFTRNGRPAPTAVPRPAAISATCTRARTAAGKPGVGWSLLDEHPTGAGVCTSCHAPAVSDDDPAQFDLREVRGTAAQRRPLRLLPQDRRPRRR